MRGSQSQAPWMGTWTSLGGGDTEPATFPQGLPVLGVKKPHTPHPQRRLYLCPTGRRLWSSERIESFLPVWAAPAPSLGSSGQLRGWELCGTGTQKSDISPRQTRSPPLPEPRAGAKTQREVQETRALGSCSFPATSALGGGAPGTAPGTTWPCLPTQVGRVPVTPLRPVGVPGRVGGGSSLLPLPRENTCGPRLCHPLVPQGPWQGRSVSGLPGWWLWGLVRTRWSFSLCLTGYPARLAHCPEPRGLLC